MTRCLRPPLAGTCRDNTSKLPLPLTVLDSVTHAIINSPSPSRPSLPIFTMTSNPVPLPTVIAQKQSFLANQTRLLSQASHPSRTWLAANDASETPLPEPVIEHAIGRLNPILTQHSRRAYSYQASRHVAEQIEALYTSQPTVVPEDQPVSGIPLLMDFSEYLLHFLPLLSLVLYKLTGVGRS